MPASPGTPLALHPTQGKTTPMHSHRARAIPIILILAALGSLVWRIPERLAAQGDTRAAVVGNPQFGLCFVSSAEDLADQARFDRAVSTGATWNRYPFYWQNIEKSPGQYDYSRHDVAVNDDVAHGLRTLAILMGTPGIYATGGVAGPAPLVQQKLMPLVAAGRVQATSLRISGASSAPANLDRPVFSDGSDSPGPGTSSNPDNPWARFIFETVSRYKPDGTLARERGWPAGAGIRHWEIWNEPDWVFFWSGSVEQYYRLLQVAYIAAKYADPTNTVILGGLATYYDPSWFPRLLDAMVADPDQAKRLANNYYLDALAIHFYSRSADAQDHMSRARSLLAEHGLGQPIWVTESGVPVWDDYPGPTWDPRSPYRSTMEEESAYIVQAHAYALYNGAEVIFHFQLHDDCGNGPEAHDAYGLFRNAASSACYPSDSGARPSYRAYQVAAEQLAGLTPLWRQTPNNDHEIIAFHRAADARRVIVMWATEGHDVQASVAASAGTAVLLDMYGSAQTIAAQNGYYNVLLPRATNQNLLGSPSAYMIGGAPYYLIEQSSPFAHMELISNGSFEAGLQGWQVAGRSPPVIATDCATAGNCLLLGSQFVADPTVPGEPNGSNSTLFQELTLDPFLAKPVLRFIYRIANAEAEPAKGWFELIIIAYQPDGSAVAEYLITRDGGYLPRDWTPAQFDLSAWRGKRIRVAFNVYQSSAEGPTMAWVDDVSLGELRYLSILPLIHHGAGN